MDGGRTVSPAYCPPAPTPREPCVSIAGSHRSESLAQLAKALASAQAKFRAIPKTRKVDFTDKQGKRVNYRYADLADVLDAVREALSAAGLSYTQPVTRDDREQLIVTTILMHESGEWIQSELRWGLVSISRPQDAGSAITYARRYGLTSLLGIASDEDDDGKAADDPQEKRAQKQQQQRKQEAPQERQPENQHEQALKLDIIELAKVKFAESWQVCLRAWLFAAGTPVLQEQTESTLRGLLKRLTAWQAKPIEVLRGAWFARLSELGVDESTGCLWAATKWAWPVDPAKGRPSLSTTPVPLVHLACQALRKVTAAEMAEWAASLDDKRFAQPAAEEAPAQ